MHEFSIVSSLIENCENIAVENNANRVIEIHVQIGERSGVNSELLASAFEEFKVGSLCADANLFIEKKKVEVKCSSCGSIYESDSIEYVTCAFCKEDTLQIISGKEMLLMRLEME